MKKESPLTPDELKKLSSISLLIPYAFLAVCWFTAPHLTRPVFDQPLGKQLLAATMSWNVIGIYLVTRVRSIKAHVLLGMIFGLPLVLTPFIVSLMSSSPR